MARCRTCLESTTNTLQAIKKHVNLQKIAQKHFHVVVDAANSVGGLTGPQLLRELGCKVTSINANIDGTFPGRMPEPRPENLTDLSATVKAIGADMGVAFDGDADRSIFVDENGTIYWGDKTFAIVIKQFLDQKSRRKNRHSRKLINPHQRHGGSLQGRVDLDQSWKRNGFAENERVERKAGRRRKRRNLLWSTPSRAGRGNDNRSAAGYHGSNRQETFRSWSLSNRSTLLRKEKSSAQMTKKNLF